MDNNKDISQDSLAGTQTAEQFVTRILTYKSGKIAFSRRYARQALDESLVRIKAIYQGLSALPILPTIASKLDTELVRRSIFGTAAIEGNSLSEEQVGELLSSPATGLRERAEQEIVNLGRAYAKFATPPADKKRSTLLVTEDLVREINRVITADIPHEHHSPGQYRNIKVEVGDGAHGGKFTPPKILADIHTLMTAFVEWINSERMLEEDPLIRAGLAHYHLALIHPFGDGNGRTARLLEAMLLTQSGYRFLPAMLSNYYYKAIDDYYIAFREAETDANSEVTGFLKFYARALLASVEEIQGNIHWHIRILALKSYYTYCLETRSITQRQNDLLTVLLQTPGKTITLKDLQNDPHLAPLYRKVTEKTARRDLHRLEELKLLLANDAGYFSNPFVLG